MAASRVILNDDSLCLFTLEKKQTFVEKRLRFAVHPNAETFANFLEHLIFQTKNLLQTDTN